MRLLNEKLKTSLISSWSKILLFILRVKVVTNYEATNKKEILVSNHISWIDAFVLGSITGSRFVVRADVSNWPILGVLVKSTNALFLDRSSPKAAKESLQILIEKINSGIPFCVFPEGTTSNGTDVLPFKSPLLQCACEPDISARPISLAYKSENGERCLRTPYVGDTTFLQSFIKILTSPTMIIAQVNHHTSHDNFECRKDLAKSLENTIRNCITNNQPSCT